MESISRAAVAAFSEVITLDLNKFGIKVAVAKPSVFRTGFFACWPVNISYPNTNFKTTGVLSVHTMPATTNYTRQIISLQWPLYDYL
jgi:hypothetical protein